MVPRLREKLEGRGLDGAARRTEVAARIAADKQGYRKEWAAHPNERVNPSLFFEELRKQVADQDIMVVDDGNHTYLAAELFEVRAPRTFISPTDFNCMGYCAPAAIGAKLVNPERQVVGIVGDGSFLMTGLELLTATTEGAGIAYFVFADGELSQISQGQQIPTIVTCTVMGAIRLEGIATPPAPVTSPSRTTGASPPASARLWPPPGPASRSWWTSASTTPSGPGLPRGWSRRCSNGSRWGTSSGSSAGRRCAR